MSDWIPTSEPGIYRDIPAETYHRWDAMSASWLKVLEERTPAHFQHQRRHPRPPTEAMAFGSATHKLILEPFDFDDEFVVAPECDRRTKAGKATWATFQESAQGREVLKRDDYNLARAIAKAVMAHPTASQMILGAEREVCLVWDDADTGVRMKARLDCLNTPWIPDLKTAVTAHPDEFVKAIWNFGYHLQAAIYCDGAEAVLEQTHGFVFIAAEKAPPYGVIARPAGETVLTAGRMAYKRALYCYRDCLKKDDWPNYDDNHEPLELPAWACRQEGIAAEALT